MSGRLAGKVAVITGAGSGMGRAMSRLFTEQGAKIIAADISGGEEETASLAGENCLPCRTDVSKSADIRAMLDLAMERFGRLDVLCNNAAVAGPILNTADYPEEEFDRIISVNLRSVFLGMKYAIPLMQKSGGGSIINTSSMAALVAFPAMSGYCASKGGVSMLTKLTAAEYAAENIRVNAILPGAIETGMTAGLPPAFLEAAVAGTLMGRIGTPDEIANLGLFLASDESSFITGALIPVDGGYTLV